MKKITIILLSLTAIFTLLLSCNPGATEPSGDGGLVKFKIYLPDDFTKSDVENLQQIKVSVDSKEHLVIYTEYVEKLIKEENPLLE